MFGFNYSSRFNHSLKRHNTENREPQLVEPLVIKPQDHEIQTIQEPFPKSIIKFLGILQIIYGILVIFLQVCMTLK